LSSPQPPSPLPISHTTFSITAAPLLLVPKLTPVFQSPFR
jgi:hypothetical protein